nr:antibiotic biosynthesis monooxygenase family protein [Novosphingobium sp. KA1]BAF03476.1 hypothetical protein [Novosphingobium sp. KA1]
MPIAKFENVVPSMSFLEQQEIDANGPVVLLNTFTVPLEQVDAMLENWREDALIMKRQPGFISAQLHCGVGAPNVIVNYAVFESMDAYRAAFRNPEFQATIAKSPEGAVMSPVLLQKLAVEGVCVV